MPKTQSLFSLARPGAGESVPPTRAGRPAAICSHIGARTEQQDAGRIWRNERTGAMLIVICDGVGGSRSGGEASAIVLQTAGQLWQDRAESLIDPQRDLLSLSRVAHERITDLARDGEKRAPASTIVALYLTATEAHWVHSGDSRLYRFRDSEVVSRTRDHSVLQILVDQGEVREKDMGSHPDQGRLLQSLGVQAYRAPSYGTAQVDEEDAFILCTDGFWERTPLSLMATILNAGALHLEHNLRKAVLRAVRANGPKSDNVTAAAVAPLHASRTARGGWVTLWPFGLLAAVLLVGMLGFYLFWHPSAQIPPKASNPSLTPTLPPSPTFTEPASKTPDTSQSVSLPKAPSRTGNGGINSLFPERSPRVKEPDVPFSNPDGVWFWQIKAFKGKVYISETEVTEEAWNRLHGGNQLGNGQLPKRMISIQEAEDYLNKLTKDHQNNPNNPLSPKWCYRLPTADEWMAAAFQYRIFAEKEKSSTLQAVDPSRVGVHDLFDNVSEIVRDSKSFLAIGRNFSQPYYDKQTVENIRASAKPLIEGAKEETVGMRAVLVQEGETPSLNSPVDSSVYVPPAPGGQRSGLEQRENSHGASRPAVVGSQQEASSD